MANNQTPQWMTTIFGAPEKMPDWMRKVVYGKKKAITPTKILEEKKAGVTVLPEPTPTIAAPAPTITPTAITPTLTKPAPDLTEIEKTLAGIKEQVPGIERGIAELATKPPTPPTPEVGVTVEGLERAIKEEEKKPQEKYAEAIREAYAPMTAAMKEYTEAIKATPSLTAQFKTLMKEQGITGLEQKMTDILTRAGQVEEQIERLPEDVKGRVQDFLITQKQYQRLTEAEAKPLTALYHSMRRAIEPVAGALEYKRKSIDTLLGLAEADTRRKQEALKAGIEMAKIGVAPELKIAEAEYKAALPGVPIYREVQGGLTKISPKTGEMEWIVPPEKKVTEATAGERLREEMKTMVVDLKGLVSGLQPGADGYYAPSDYEFLEDIWAATFPDKMNTFYQLFPVETFINPDYHPEFIAPRKGKTPFEIMMGG